MKFEYLSLFSVIHRADTLENPASYLLGKVTYHVTSLYLARIPLILVCAEGGNNDKH